MTDQIDTNVEDANNTPVTDVNEATEQGATLTIQDLTTAMQIIQVTGARGAVRADEMAVVGNLYNKIFAFLDAAGAIKHEDAAADTADTADAGVESIDTTAAE